MRLVIIALITCLSLTTTSLSAQEVRLIAINGTAEKEVVPDEIYLNITLSEPYNGPVSATIENQEAQIRKALTGLGIDLTNLTLSNENASYTRINWNDKEVEAKKSYSLKLKDANIVGKVFRALFDMGIKEANIYKVDYSNKEALKDSLRTRAIQDAKAKATSMLAAVDESIGKLANVTVNETNQREYYGGANLMSSRSANTDDNDFVEFKKMKFSITASVKYDIK